MLRIFLSIVAPYLTPEGCECQPRYHPWYQQSSKAKLCLHVGYPLLCGEGQCIKRPVPLASRLYFLVTNVARYHFHCVTTSYCYSYHCIGISLYLVAYKIASNCIDLTFFITEYKLVDINKFSISFLSGIEQTETSRNYRFDNREFESRSPWTMQHRGHCELYEPAVTGVWITEDTRVVAPVVEDVLPLVRNLIFNFTGKSSFEIARQTKLASRLLG